MGTKEVRGAIRSDVRLVAVEAPAGCGKTYEAASGALDLAAELPANTELLLLAHTNAAVGEFRGRIRGAGSRIRAATLDAFALELVAPYATALWLPTPLELGDGPGQVPFQDLATRAAELLRRAPTLARAIGKHYPLIFVDEYQDTRPDQFTLVNLLVEAGGSRLRTFADPMQAIFDMDELVDWEDHCRNADALAALTEPRRWDEAPDLGVWTLAAREALRQGETLPLDLVPPSVRVRRIEGLSGSPNPYSRQVQPELIRPLNAVARSPSGSVAVLTRYNESVRGLNAVLRGSHRIQEGAEFGPAYGALDLAEESIGDPRSMASAIVSLLSSTCTGLTKALKAQVSQSLLVDRIEPGRKVRIKPLLDALVPLYAAPDIATWCRCIEALLSNPPDWLKIDLGLNLRVLSLLRPVAGESATALLDASARRLREGAIRPRRCISTIHKAKGQEYDHVVIVHCSESVFDDSIESRRLLYTAISRAKRSVTILVPEHASSPLVS